MFKAQALPGDVGYQKSPQVTELQISEDELFDISFYLHSIWHFPI